MFRFVPGSAPSWPRLLICWLVCSLFGLARPAAGALILEIPDATIQAGDPAPAVEVVLRVTSGSPTLASYNVGLVVLSEPPGEDLDLLEAVETVVHAPIFPGQDPLDGFPVPDDDTLYVADDLDSGSVPITDGAGLFRVRLALSPAATIGNDFVVGFDPNTTFLFTSDEQQQVHTVPIDELRAGTITVVPEPASLLLAAVALAALAVYRGRRNDS